MKKAALLSSSALLSATTSLVQVEASEVKYNLPISYSCNGKEQHAIGGAICAQDEGNKHSLKVKIPPTKGQLRVVDCNGDLTEDGNPDDFNTQVEKKGWFLWRRTIRIMSNTPDFVLNSSGHADCAIAASVAAQDTGVQTALLIYEPRKKDDFLSLVCGKEHITTSDGVAKCIALEGAKLAFFPSEPGVFLAKGTSCGINLRSEVGANGSVDFRVPAGPCVIDVSLVREDTTVLYSRILVIGKDRGSRELDSPLILVTRGMERVVYMPIGAELLNVEAYQGDKVVWRSGRVNTEEGAFSSKGVIGSDSWPDGLVLCATAYSRPLNSMSQSCYKAKTMRQVPYYFR